MIIRICLFVYCPITFGVIISHLSNLADINPSVVAIIGMPIHNLNIVHYSNLDIHPLYIRTHSHILAFTDLAHIKFEVHDHVLGTM